jgi:hypothetical protein
MAGASASAANTERFLMTQFLLILQLVNQLFPLLIQTVRAVEAAFPQSGQGAAKLDLVRSTLESSYATVTASTVAFESLWPTLSAVVAGLVKLQKTVPPST